ncbi:MAG: hypothetical protein L0154_22285 [Chloroflexi bacterium]|nr:hypothetical protein [Chloroflexota bacterium]
MRLIRSGKLVLLLFVCLLLTMIPFLFGVLNQPDEEPAPAVQETISATATENYTPPDPIIIEVGTVEATEIVDTEGTAVASTLDYLALGASNGNRNRSLFDAACQFRDARYSQTEAEQHLIARYMADGTGDENLATREREAKATITSAYSEAPRDPIAEPIPDAKKLVSKLVAQFGTDEKKDHPTAEQIAEAVRTCAHLEAVEWAVERQRIKDMCGNGIRVTDLDRQYRQARKEIERERPEEHDESAEYYDDDGHIIYRRDTYRGPVERTVADWVGRVIERISQVNEDGDEEHHAVLELRHDEQVMRLQVPTEVFGDDAALRRFISGKAGEAFTVKAGMGKHLAPAILSLSGNYPHRTCYHFMGWTKVDDRWTYISPGASVNADGIVEDGLAVELSPRLHDYKLQEASWEDSLHAFRAMVPVFPKHLAPTCIAFALLPVLQGFFPVAAPRPAIHLAGTYGSGKSELAALMSSFYGIFSRDTPPAQWGDTINTVEAGGHPLASALYWVDDYKTIYADERTFTRFLQSYSRGMGRGRLTREAKVKQERPCRGLILSTGETVLEGEASVLSRMLVLDVPSWEHRDPDGAALGDADRLRQHLSGFTIRFAQWVAVQVEEHNLTKRLSDEFDVSVKGYREKLTEAGISMANTGRIIQKWAVLVTTYRMLLEFVDDCGVEDILPPWQDVIIETAQTVRQERASEVFMNTLEQLLASGDVMLATDTKNPEEPRPGSTLVGYRHKEYVYLLPEIASKAVNRVHPLKFTTAAIGSQLKEDGYLIATNSDAHLTVQVRIRGNRVRVWRLKAGVFTGDSGDNGDSTEE